MRNNNIVEKYGKSGPNTKERKENKKRETILKALQGKGEYTHVKRGSAYNAFDFLYLGAPFSAVVQYIHALEQYLLKIYINGQNIVTMTFAEHISARRIASEIYYYARY